MVISAVLITILVIGILVFQCSGTPHDKSKSKPSHLTTYFSQASKLWNLFKCPSVTYWSHSLLVKIWLPIWNWIRKVIGMLSSPSLVSSHLTIKRNEVISLIRGRMWQGTCIMPSWYDPGPSHFSWEWPWVQGPKNKSTGHPEWPMYPADVLSPKCCSHPIISETHTLFVH